MADYEEVIPGLGENDSVTDGIFPSWACGRGGREADSLGLAAVLGASSKSRTCVSILVPIATSKGQKTVEADVRLGSCGGVGLRSLINHSAAIF